MKKNFFIALLVIAALALGVYFICKGTPQQASVVSNHSVNTPQSLHENNNPTSSPVSPSSEMQQNGSATSTWKTYTNKRLGFTFQYPVVWSKNGEEANVTNLSGIITEVDIQFTDISSNTTLLVAYHLPPGGTELYRYAISQYQARKGWYATGAKELTISGNKAVEALLTTSTDGRGNKLNHPLRSIIVDVQDKKKTGEIQFQFQTPEANEEKEVVMFHQLLSGFRFTD